MTLTIAILLGALGLDSGREDPAALAQQLGASRYAERQAATKALESLGGRALPALRDARHSPDAEVRARASELIRRIEAELLVQPTMVRLDFTDAPLPEVVSKLAERTGISMALVPENNPIWQARRVTLTEPGPLTFWQAMDRLCREAGLRHAVAQGGVTPGRNALVQLYAGGGPVEGAILCESGPFRVSAEGINYRLERRFGIPAQAVRIVQPGGLAVPPSGGSSNAQFYVDLQVLAEPRMVVSPSGPLKLAEAVDDLGTSLLPAEPTDSHLRNSGYTGFSASTTTMSMQVHLRYPARPGKTIRRLRGTIPVVISARRDDPMIIELEDARGKTFQAADVAIQIHDVRAEADGLGTLIDLSVRPNASDGTDPAIGGPGRFGAELMALRSPNMPQSQIEILDAQGRHYRQWFPNSTHVDQNEIRMTLRLQSQGEVGPPAQLRFYDMNRASTEVAFDFTDIPMP